MASLQDLKKLLGGVNGNPGEQHQGNVKDSHRDSQRQQNVSDKYGGGYEEVAEDKRGIGDLRPSHPKPTKIWFQHVTPWASCPPGWGSSYSVWPHRRPVKTKPRCMTNLKVRRGF